MTAPLQYPCGNTPGFCPNPTDPAEASTTPVPTAGCHIVDGTADRRCTPGALNPNVTQANIHQTICVPHWTDPPVRPPTSYTDALKRTQKIAYGEAAIPNAQLEEDHLVNLGIGGAPRDPRNLWPEPRVGLHKDGAGDKDREEVALQRAVCAPGSKLLLADAQAQILALWSH
jgi:hypothetical protein